MNTEHFIATEDTCPRVAYTYTVVYLNLKLTAIYIKASCDTLTIPSDTWSACSDLFKPQIEAGWSLAEWRLSGHQVYTIIAKSICSHYRLFIKSKMIFFFLKQFEATMYSFAGACVSTSWSSSDKSCWGKNVSGSIASSHMVISSSEGH